MSCININVLYSSLVDAAYIGERLSSLVIKNAQFHHRAEGDVVLVNEEDVMECWMRKRKLVVKPAMAGDCGMRGTRALLVEFLLTRLIWLARSWARPRSGVWQDTSNSCPSRRKHSSM